MRTPSRRMPKLPTREVSGLHGALLLGLIFAMILGAILCVLVLAPVAGSVVLAILLARCLIGVRHSKAARRAVQQLAAARRGESICQFARSFDRRATDTWVLRAVYEELQSSLAIWSPSFPVHADDSILKDLAIDPEDFSLELPRSIAKRAGRSLDQVNLNPYQGRVATVRDLVSFFLYQPRVASRSESA